MNVNLLQCTDVLNRVFAAYFMNIADNKGVNFEESKPTFKPIAEFNEGICFTQDVNLHWMKYFYHGKILFEELDIDELKNVSIEDFFDDDLKSKVADLACDFSERVKENSPCDFVFSDMPDCQPFISSFCIDPETNFKSRLIVGKDFVTNKWNCIFEFYCLLMQKVREEVNE